MTDEQASKLLELLNLYVATYGGPDTSKGDVNPHTMTLAELHDDLTTSLS